MKTILGYGFYIYDLQGIATIIRETEKSYIDDQGRQHPKHKPTGNGAFQCYSTHAEALAAYIEVVKEAAKEQMDQQLWELDPEDESGLEKKCGYSINIIVEKNNDGRA